MQKPAPKYFLDYTVLPQYHNLFQYQVLILLFVMNLYVQSGIFTTVIANLLIFIYCLWPENAWFLHITFLFNSF